MKTVLTVELFSRYRTELMGIAVIGVYAGKLSLYNNHTGSTILLCLVGISWIISYFLKNRLGYAMAIYTMSEKIVYMFAICTLFSVSKDMILTKWIRKILKWLGHYSLELYVLHLLIFSFLSSETLFGDKRPDKAVRQAPLRPASGA